MARPPAIPRLGCAQTSFAIWTHVVLRRRLPPSPELRTARGREQQHGTHRGTAAHDPVGGASNQQTVKESMPVGTEDDE